MSIWSSKTSTQGWRKWVKDQIDTIVAASGATQLDELSDVTTAAVTAKYALMADGAAYVGRALVEADISDLTHVAELGDLSDVGTANVTNRNVLVADGVDFEGRALVEADVSDLQAYILNISGSPLSELSDATITGIASGEILKWNGSAWINNTLVEAGIGDVQSTGDTMTGALVVDETVTAGALQTGTDGAFWRGNYPSVGTTYSAASTYIANNAYVDSADAVSDQYRTSNTHASYGHTIYQQAGGVHTWFGNNNSVTADAVVTKQTLMGLDASGNLTLSGTVDGRDVAADGTTLDNIPVGNLADGTDGELITWSAAGAPTTVAVGTTNHVLTSNGAGAAPTFQAAAGGSSQVVQIVNTQTGAVSTTTTTMPADDTIPQNTEGGQVLSLAITPDNTANILKFDIHVIVGSSVLNGRLGIGLFQDSTASAIASTMASSGRATNRFSCHSFSFWMVAGTTSSTTFKVRAGLSDAGTLTFNGFLAGRMHGGVGVTGMTITEYLP